MPLRERHLLKARHQLDFKRLLDGLGKQAALYIDWKIIVCYHAAIHYIDAILANFGLHAEKHAQREDYVIKHLNQIYPPYFVLKYLCETVQYRADAVINASEDDLFETEQRLKIIENFVTGALGVPP